MENIFSRYRNLIVLLAVVLAQVIGLAVQVRKPQVSGTAGPVIARDTADGQNVRLIRLWAAAMVTPFERAIHGSGQGLNSVWGDYVDLRHTREENKQLQQTVDRLRLEQATILEDAKQGQRLQGLLNFQQKYIYKTIPAQVIGTSGSSQSHVIWLDKGSNDGLKPDMAVITGDGIVGKVRDVTPNSAQVLMINDQSSGAGVVLQTTRTRGILRGNESGQPQVVNILADKRILPGEQVLTAGGDQIFPRGLPVGVVESIKSDPERGSFIEVVVKPAAQLQHLDEVLVVTSMEAHLSAQQQADLKTSEEVKGAEVAADAERKRVAAEMSQRLPGLKDADAEEKKDEVKPGAQPGAPPAVPATPKPLPAKHPDRFSPEGGEVPGAGRDPDGAINGDAAAKPKKPARPAAEGDTTKPAPQALPQADRRMP
jgi:rod shape-determining protein MreC